MRPPMCAMCPPMRAHLRHLANTIEPSIFCGPAKMAEPIETPFGLWTRVGPRKHVSGGMHTRRHLANTVEPSMCGGDAAFVSNYFDHLLLLLLGLQYVYVRVTVCLCFVKIARVPAKRFGHRRQEVVMAVALLPVSPRRSQTSQSVFGRD